MTFTSHAGWTAYFSAAGLRWGDPLVREAADVRALVAALAALHAFAVLLATLSGFAALGLGVLSHIALFTVYAALLLSPVNVGRVLSLVAAVAWAGMAPVDRPPSSLGLGVAAGVAALTLGPVGAPLMMAAQLAALYGRGDASYLDARVLTESGIVAVLLWAATAVLQESADRGQLRRDRLERVIAAAVDRIVPLKGASFSAPQVIEPALVHPSDLPDLSNAARGIVRVRHPDGGWGWYESRPVELADDPDVGGTIAVLHDVTAIREAELAAVHRVRHESSHDALTGLANRRLLIERVRAAMRNRTGVIAVIYCDLDHFKIVNDSLGHDFGDRLLVALAERLKSAAGASEVVARIGGDEFVILLEKPGDEGQARARAEVCRTLLQDPVVLGEHRISPGASVGLAFLHPSHQRPEHLLRDADLALYSAKSRGRNRVAVFDADLRRAAEERHNVQQELRTGLASGQLDVAWQPQIDFATGMVCGFEALARWNHPTRGMVSPGVFIPVAEETGLIVEMGLQILDRAVAQLVKWQNVSTQVPRPRVAVNLSPRQLYSDADIVRSVRRVLQEHNADPSLLELEVTESALIDDPPRVQAILSELRAIGVRIAIDDFGTGYSSLAYLARLPLDVLKVDRAFVSKLGADPRGTEITRLILELGRSLGVETLAEGVETEPQRTWLRTMGATVGQGFLFSPPVPAAKATEILKAQPWSARGRIREVGSARS